MNSSKTLVQDADEQRLSLIDKSSLQLNQSINYLEQIRDQEMDSLSPTSFSKSLQKRNYNSRLSKIIQQTINPNIQKNVNEIHHYYSKINQTIGCLDDRISQMRTSSEEKVKNSMESVILKLSGEVNKLTVQLQEGLNNPDREYINKLFLCLKQYRDECTKLFVNLEAQVKENRRLNLQLMDVQSQNKALNEQIRQLKKECLHINQLDIDLMDGKSINITSTSTKHTNQKSVNLYQSRSPQQYDSQSMLLYIKSYLKSKERPATPLTQF